MDEDIRESCDIELSFAGPDESSQSLEDTYDAPRLTVRVEMATPPPQSAPVSPSQAMGSPLLNPPLQGLSSRRTSRPATAPPTTITFPEDTIGRPQSSQTDTTAYDNSRDIVDVSLPPPPLCK